jgi:hypothetical protein
LSINHLPQTDVMHHPPPTTDAVHQLPNGV